MTEVPGTSGRLLRLLSLLQARRDWPGDALAERLDVSPRTVRRDVDRLRELGYPVRATKGPDGGYRLDAGADLPPLLFDDEQAVAVAVALQTATSSVAGIEEGALRALATVRQVMPARLRQRVDALQVTAVSKNDPQRPKVDTEHLIAIGTAVRAREILRFDYDAPNWTGEERPWQPPRRVEPHHLVTWGGRWYLISWDLDRADWRTFRVDRMTPKTPTGPRFSPRELPGGDVAATSTRPSAAASGPAAASSSCMRRPPRSPPGCVGRPSSNRWGRTAAGCSPGRGPGTGWPPGSGCSTSTWKSSDRLNSRTPHDDSATGTRPPHPAPDRRERRRPRGCGCLRGLRRLSQPEWARGELNPHPVSRTRT